MNEMCKEFHEQVISLLTELSENLRSVTIGDGIRVLGKDWGDGDYRLASYCMLDVHKRFHEITYVVFEGGDDTVLSIGATKADAIRTARHFVQATTGNAKGLLAMIRERRAAIEAAREEERMRPFREWQAQQTREKSIPKRRLEIFNKSEGKCHYCSTPLDLTGKWHIEHMMPKALMGSNDPSNLVASCVSCNMKKRDTTADEFKARLASEVAA